MGKRPKPATWNPSTTRADSVIVIGAGAAGLMAARDLSRAGIRTILLEARGRIGGRIFTIHEGSDLPIELGAEFVHGEVDEVIQLARAAATVIEDVPEVRWQVNRGRAVPMLNFWEKTGELLRALPGVVRDGDVSIHEFLNRSKASAAAKKLFRGFVEGYHGAQPELISARSLAAGDGELDSREYRQLRIASGYDVLLRHLVEGFTPGMVDLRFNRTVTDIEWRKGEVLVRGLGPTGTENVVHRGRAVVVTVPHAVLKAGALRFAPTLDEHQRAFATQQVAQVFKIILEFREPLWEEESLRRRLLPKSSPRSERPSFFLAPDAPVPTWWTTLPSRSARITGWVGGPGANSFLTDTPNGRLDRSLQSLSDSLAIPRPRLDDQFSRWWSHDWYADPLSRGAYTYVGVGGSSARKTMGEPVEGTIFFAGEATDEERMATVAGALASGRRAAARLIERWVESAPHPSAALRPTARAGTRRRGSKPA